jgi:hypothetical protein
LIVSASANGLADENLAALNINPLGEELSPLVDTFTIAVP